MTEKTDIYSLGMLFFSMIAGRFPYNGDETLLTFALSVKARPEVDPSWHQGFVQVKCIYVGCAKHLMSQPATEARLLASERVSSDD